MEPYSFQCLMHYFMKSGTSSVKFTAHHSVHRSCANNAGFDQNVLNEQVTIFYVFFREKNQYGTHILMSTFDSKGTKKNFIILLRIAYIIKYINHYLKTCMSEKLSNCTTEGHDGVEIPHTNNKFLHELYIFPSYMLRFRVDCFVKY